MCRVCECVYVCTRVYVCVYVHAGACFNAEYRKVWQIPYCKSWKEQKCDVAEQVLLLFSVILKSTDTI